MAEKRDPEIKTTENEEFSDIEGALGDIPDYDNSQEVDDMLAAIMKRRLGSSKNLENETSQGTRPKRRKLETCIEMKAEVNKDIDNDEVDGSFGIEGSVNKVDDNSRTKVTVNKIDDNFGARESVTDKDANTGNVYDIEAKTSKSETIHMFTDSEAPSEALATINDLSKQSESDNQPELDQESDSIPFAFTCFQSLNATVEDETSESIPDNNDNNLNDDNRSDNVTTPEVDNSQSDDDSRTGSGQVFSLFKLNVAKTNDTEVESQNWEEDDQGSMIESNDKAEDVREIVENESPKLDNEKDEFTIAVEDDLIKIPVLNAAVNKDNKGGSGKSRDLNADVKGIGEAVDNESHNVTDCKREPGSESIQKESEDGTYVPEDLIKVDEDGERKSVDFTTVKESQGIAKNSSSEMTDLEQGADECMKAGDGFTDNSNDVNDSDVGVKMEVKKSRKQTIPRRHLKTEINENEINDKEDKAIEKTVDSKDEQAAKVESAKFEKSRKQLKPQRIAKDSAELEMGSADKQETKMDINVEVCVKTEKVEKDNDATRKYSEVSDCWKADTDSVGLDKGCKLELGDLENDGIFKDSADSPYGVNYNNKPSVDPSALPGLDFHSENLNLYAKLSPSFSTFGVGSNFAMGNSNDLVNYEVIRQLREFRCTKYRKISVAEKREIAEYARSNGVSQAANIYNVSKSAVSMWTRMDLDELEELDEKRKKNCMLGNERFEKLCAKVREQRVNKYKGLCKTDKLEISKYAKLVGVREMARCLDVALGTVSGWMRQFPYQVNVNNPDNGEAGNKGNHSNDVGSLKTKGVNLESDSPENTESKSTKLKKRKRDSSNFNKEALKIENTAGKEKLFKGEYSGISETKDEVDDMIVESMYKLPDIEQLYEESRSLMAGTELEGDGDFKKLFARVVQCKVHKYKTLSAADKMSVCLYGRRFGVRKVGRVLGLATGTLSGWNSKYHVYLNTDAAGSSADIPEHSDSLDLETWRDKFSGLDPLNNSYDALSQSPSTSAARSAVVMEADKSEVMAVKCLMKERFESMVKKIELARTMKFRNISVEEKIEIVKCSKLVGIRPTARVLNVPIGTLSGWITKYSNKLHPVYNISEEDSSMVGEGGNVYPNTTLAYPGLSGWTQGLVSNSNLNFSNPDFSKFGMYNGLPSLDQISTDNGRLEKPEDNGDAGSGQSHEFRVKMENIVKLENGEMASGSGEKVAMKTSEHFETEAARLAQQYVQTAYRNMGLPML